MIFCLYEKKDEQKSNNNKNYNNHKKTDINYWFLAVFGHFSLYFRKKNVYIKEKIRKICWHKREL